MLHQIEVKLREGRNLRIEKKLGQGSFGDIFLAKHMFTEEEFAIKFESCRSRHPLLLNESKVYKHLRGGVGIPNVHWFDTIEEYNLLAVDLLGPSLEDLFERCGQKFSLRTVSLLAQQILSRLEHCHNQCIIHRDIKPHNFLMGIGKANLVCHIIDFGLSKKYRCPKTKDHILYREDKRLTGTVRYASINALCGIEQSRRDDLESVGYVLLYFLKGNLPWQGLQAKTKKEKYDKIVEKKKTTSIETLCNGIPKEFEDYMKYIRNLGFNQDPDYNYLKNLFHMIYSRETFLPKDIMFDWTVTLPSKGVTNNTSNPFRKSEKKHVSTPRHQFSTMKMPPLMPLLVPKRVTSVTNCIESKVLQVKQNEKNRIEHDFFRRDPTKKSSFSILKKW